MVSKLIVNLLTIYYTHILLFVNILHEYIKDLIFVVLILLDLIFLDLCHYVFRIP